MRLDEAPQNAVRPDEGVTAVICFAFADLPSIRALRDRVAGDHVHLVPGIDCDLEGVVVHLLHDSPTVVVVVHSAALQSSHLEAVLATFSKQRDRNHRLCVVEFDADDPASFLAEVSEAVDAMRHRLEHGSGKSGLFRTPSMSGSFRAPGDDDAGSTDDTDSSDALELGEVSGDEVVPEPSPSASTNQRVLDPLTTTDPGESQSGTTYPNLRPAFGDVRLGRADPTRSRTRMWVVAAVAVAVAAGGALWMGRSSDGRDTAVADRGVPNSAPAATSRAPSAPADVEEDVVPPTSPYIVTEDPDRVATAVDGVEISEARRIAAALDSDKIHALDALLVRRLGREPEPYADARRRCARLDVADIGKWRLPTLDELRTLRRARMLPAGTYWSSRTTKSAVYTLDRDVTRPMERAKDDTEVRVLCVRLR